MRVRTGNGYWKERKFALVWGYHVLRSSSYFATVDEVRAKETEESSESERRTALKKTTIQIARAAILRYLLSDDRKLRRRFALV